ncbi:branched-chain amino acid ABC transporter substrate-binding protein [Brucella lupini]|uniref:Branched-chain amino acid ABC transporter substrate-binding protein n=3 Tax=Brucella lupini TaxID=255457 RepID=A0AB34DGC4_9HYPH|nr:branched-chain amino acid ABC transporter substrate-binding protein [Brucella lupini]
MLRRAYSPLGFLACVMFAGIPIANPAHAELRIAMIETMSGSQASSGEMFRNGLEYVIGKINRQGGFRGEPITFKVYDSAGTTTGAAQRFQEAVSDNMDLVIQGASSAIAGQLTDDVRKFNMRNPGKEKVFITVGAGAMELTGQRCHYYAFRFYPTPSMWAGALVNAMKGSGALEGRVYAINQDYSWGQDWQKATEELAGPGGYTIVGETLHDVNRIQDFSPYVAKIKIAEPDTVITGNWSNDLLLLMKATKDAGLSARFATSNLDQPGNLANAGLAALGHYNASMGSPEIGDGSFAEEYRKAYGRYPAYNDISASVSMEFIMRALQSVKGEGDVAPAEIVAAIEGFSYDSAYGPQSVRIEDHQFLMPLVVTRVDKNAKYKADGTDMGFLPIATVEPDNLIYPVQDTCRMKRP